MFLALNESIIKIVFERGEFTAENTKITATALFYYSFGMTGYAVCEILNKSFYAIRDGKTPMYTSIIGVLVNLVSAFVFIKLLDMGIGGLALSSAVSSLFMAAFLIFMINKRKQGIITKAFAINILKILFCAAASGFAAAALYPLTDFFGTGFLGTLIHAGICAACALIIYLVLGFTLRINEFKQIRRLNNED